MDKKVQNLTIAIATGVIFLFAILPSYAKYVAVFGAPIVCLIARFVFSKNAMASKIALGTILAGVVALITTRHPIVWVLEALLMILVPIVVLWKALPALISAEKEEDDKKKGKTNKKSALDLEAEHKARLDQIDSDEKAAKSSFETTLATAKKAKSDYESRRPKEVEMSLRRLTTNLTNAQQDLQAREEELSTIKDERGLAERRLSITKGKTADDIRLDRERLDELLQREGAAITARNTAITRARQAQNQLNDKNDQLSRDTNSKLERLDAAISAAQSDLDRVDLSRFARARQEEGLRYSKALIDAE